MFHNKLLSLYSGIMVPDWEDTFNAKAANDLRNMFFHSKAFILALEAVKPYFTINN